MDPSLHDVFYQELKSNITEGEIGWYSRLTTREAQE